MSQYKRTTKFSPPPTLKGKSADEMGRVVEQHLRDIAKKLNDEFRDLERTSVGSNVTTVINGTGSSGSSGSGSGTASDFLRAGSQAATTAGTTISFSSAITGSFILLIRAYDSLNVTVGCDITNVTSTGFTATPVVNCTVQFAALVNT